MKTKFPILSLGLFMMFTAAWTSPGYQVEKSESDSKASLTATKPVGDFSFFRTHRQGKGIAASWGLNSETGTVGFWVEKTYEDPTDPYAVWEEVEYVPCTGSRSYKSIDKNVYPGNISYRVVAQKANGTSGETAISMVRIVSH